MAAKGWQRAFDDPIPIPRGRQLVTLWDAALHITELPKAEHDALEWQAAMEALLLVAEDKWADDVCTHRNDAGIEPSRGTGVR
jgi:hypothetical protein